jgi:hypothetical protein
MSDLTLYKTLDELEELERQVMQVAAWEARLLVEKVSTEAKVRAAAEDDDAVQAQTNYKKNVSHTFLLCERMLRYISARKQVGKWHIEPFPEADLERLQRKAVAGISAAKQRLGLTFEGEQVRERVKPN